MGGLTLIGTILVITGWLTLLEYDKFNEEEKREILQRIKRRPDQIVLIALMPVGLLVASLGIMLFSVMLYLIGSSLILLQAVIISILFWKRARWKSVIMLATVLILGSFVYIPYLF